MIALLLCSLLNHPGQLSGPEKVPFLKIPEGFEVFRFTNDLQTPDIYCIAFGPNGQLLVSGKNYIRIVHDSNLDGIPDAIHDLPFKVQDGPTGLCWEGDNIWFTANQGLWVTSLKTGNPQNATVPRKLLTFKTGGEHEAHAVRKGPDGNIYILCGNNTGINSRHATHPASPIKNPVAGTLLRFHPDSNQCEILVDGLRNPFGFDFNLEGEIFTYDSDNERCISLPWYEGTRLYHLKLFGRYGWWNPQRADTWRSPPWHADIQKPLADLGRGSPTGVACCTSKPFGASRLGSIFIADWTFGRIWECPLQPRGSSYSSSPKVFMEPRGTSGFAPTSIAFHPITGEMFVSMGGRGTQGSIFRIRPVALSGEKNPLVSSKRDDFSTRESALKSILATDLLQRRKAIEFLATHPGLDSRLLAKSLAENLSHEDPGIQQATIALASSIQEQIPAPLNLSIRGQNALGLALLDSHPQREGTLAIQRIASGNASLEEQLVATRIVQLAMGNLPFSEEKSIAFEGYRVQKKRWSPTEQDWRSLGRMYPTPLPTLNMELERAFAMGQVHDPEIAQKVFQSLAQTNDPIRKIHLLLVLGSFPTRLSSNNMELVVQTLLNLGGEIAQKNLKRDRNWPLRLQELYQHLASQNPTLNQRLVESKLFGSQEHAVFLKHLGVWEKQASQKFAQAILRSPDSPWTSATVQSLRLLETAEAKPALRALWGNLGLDDMIALQLSRNLEKEDLGRIYEILPRISPEGLATLLTTLAKSTPIPDAQSMSIARRYSGLGKEPDNNRTREAILEFLRKQYPTSPGQGTMADWLTWASREKPDLARALQESAGVNIADWLARANKIDWSKGNAEAGFKSFQQRKCATCHGGAAAIGPSLEGVSKRFSREDLLQSLLLPDKDVPNRYRATAYTTHKGNIVIGMVIYDSAAGAMIQLANGETLRLGGEEIASRQSTGKSLMPAGLLDGATDQEIADLFAYLNQPVK